MTNRTEAGEERAVAGEPRRPERSASGLTRRRALLGLVAVGSVGATAGAGTRAFLTDREGFGNLDGGEANQFRGGDLDLGVAWETATNGEPVDSSGPFPPESSTDYGDVSGPVLELAGITPGDGGRVSTAFRVAGNPACVWFRLRAFDADDNGLTDQESELDSTGGDGEGELQEFLDVTVHYDVDCDGTRDEGEPEIADGTLSAVAEELSTGVRLDAALFEDGVSAGECFPPGSAGCVTLAWTLPEVRGVRQVETDSVTFGVELGAVQRRHDEGSTSPWEGT